MARSFNGSSDYIPLLTAAVPRQPTLPFSVGAWVYQQARGSIGSTIIEVGRGGVGGFALDVGSGTDSTKLTFVKLGIAEITGGLTVPTGRWVFVGAVLLSTKVHFVMVDNGVLSTNDVANSSALNNDTNGESQIGAARGSGGLIDTHYYWNGRVQDVFFVTRQLGDEEWRSLGMGQPVASIAMNDHWPLTGRDNSEIEVGGMPSYGTLVGTTPSPDVAPRGGFYRQRTWRDQVLPLFKAATSLPTPISDSDLFAFTSAVAIAASVSAADLAALADAAAASVGITAVDSATITDASSAPIALTPVAKIDTDNATGTDSVLTASKADLDVFHLSETEAVVALTPTAISDSDSATETEGPGIINAAAVISSSDTATLSSTAAVTVVPPVDLNDADRAVLAEAWSLLVAVASSDSFAFSQADGGPPGGGGAGDGGGTGSGGGTGVKVHYGRRSLVARI